MFGLVRENRSGLCQVLMTIALLITIAWTLLAQPPAPVFFTDFDSGVPPQISGVTTLAPVAGFRSYGFSWSFLHNDTVGGHTVVTLTNLPAHNRLQLRFLLAIVDSWDGESNFGGGAPADYFNVVVDGVTVFSKSYDNFRQADQTAPTANTMVWGRDIGFTGATTGGIALDPGTPFLFGPLMFPDSAYDMGHPSANLDSIQHTASTVTIEFFASGSGYQGGADESWAIDNLEVLLFSVTQNGLHLHGSGAQVNPPTLFLNTTPATGATARYNDSPSLQFAGGNLWQVAGVWPAFTPPTSGTIQDVRLWAGLSNAADQGAAFDLRVEIYKNGTLMAVGDDYCNRNLSADPNNARFLTIPLTQFPPVAFSGSDSISLTVRTRVGTSANGAQCAIPGATSGLRLYFDSSSRRSKVVTY